MDKSICFIGDAFRVLPSTHYQAIICKKKILLQAYFLQISLNIEIWPWKKAILVYMQVLGIFFEAKEGCWLIGFVVYVTKLSGMALAVDGLGLC